MISHFFIDRPIFASVLSIVIVVLGLVALQGLPIAQFPEITPPVIQIDADYPGASAEVIANYLRVAPTAHESGETRSIAQPWSPGKSRPGSRPTPA